MIHLHQLTAGYGRHKVIDNLECRIEENDFFGIIGPNGAGKSTLLRLILGLQKPWQGQIICRRGLRFGGCMQRINIDEIFPFTVREVVMMGRNCLIGPWKRPKAEDRDKVEESLQRTEITNLADRPFNQLSGGQKQRTLIARALAAEPHCLVLDEPTNDLDIKGGRELLRLLGKLHKELNLTVILVSHELERVLNHAERFLFLNLDKNPILISRDELDESTLCHIFELDLQLDKVNGKLAII